MGDDDQSIYGWRGAEVTHILNFQRDWPDAKVVRLEDNYRSTREIIAWANRLIAFNRKRHAKVLRASVDGETPRILQLEDEAVEARTVVGEIASRVTQLKRKLQATSPSSAARTSSPGRSSWNSGGPRSPTCWWAACRSTIARKFATCWPT